MNKKVLVIGGTGFIGFHVCKELFTKGYSVTAVSIDDLKENFMPKEVEIRKADVNKLNETEIEALFKDQDCFIFAAGVDDRTVVKAPAYDFFYNANVASLEKLLIAAKKQNVKKVVILNSYFAYFNRIWPEMHLAENHPYIRSRKEQQEMSFKICDDSMPAAVLELPYIVGVTPTKGSLWNGLIEYVNSGMKYKFYTAGGTAVVSLKNVAVATVNALEKTNINTIYQVVDVNLTWKEWLNALRSDKTKEIKIITIPKFLVKVGAFLMLISHKLKGKEAGLNIVKFIDLQTKNTFLPIEESKKALDYSKYNLDEEFDDTIRLCLNKQ